MIKRNRGIEWQGQRLKVRPLSGNGNVTVGGLGASVLRKKGGWVPPLLLFHAQFVKHYKKFN